MARSFTLGARGSRTSQIRRVLWIVLLLNLLVALAKYIYGVISSSASMQADGIHSIFDSAGNIVGLVGITMAARPADDDHPYGHSKFETYASVVIGVLLLFAAFNVGSSAVSSLMEQRFEADVTVVSFVVMIITLVINISVSLLERRQAVKLDSEILRADASHTASDAMVSIGVIIGLILVQLGFPAADPIMALLVTLAILYTAFEVFKRAAATFSDKARIPEEDIIASIDSIPGVRNIHNVRTRGTQGDVFVDLHILVDQDATVASAHALSEKIEDAIMQAFPTVHEVLVHIEPYDENHIQNERSKERSR